MLGPSLIIVILVVKRHCCSHLCADTPPYSFPPVSGNTPIAVWGTHLDLIQNPQIRAKHGGKEHINVSAEVAQRATFPKGMGYPKLAGHPDPEDPLHTTAPSTGMVR